MAIMALVYAGLQDPPPERHAPIVWRLFHQRIADSTERNDRTAGPAQHIQRCYSHKFRRCIFPPNALTTVNPQLPGRTFSPPRLIIY
jgi:hypothetical protein